MHKLHFNVQIKLLGYFHEHCRDISKVQNEVAAQQTGFICSHLYLCLILVMFCVAQMCLKHQKKSDFYKHWIQLLIHAQTQELHHIFDRISSSNTWCDSRSPPSFNVKLWRVFFFLFYRLYNDVQTPRVSSKKTHSCCNTPPPAAQTHTHGQRSNLCAPPWQVSIPATPRQMLMCVCECVCVIQY